MTNIVPQEPKSEGTISPQLAASRRIMALGIGPDADFVAAFDACMEEAALAQERGDHESVRSFLKMAGLFSTRRQRELVRRADAYRLRRMRCRALPVRTRRRGRAHRRVGVARVAAKCTSTGDPADPDGPPRPARSLRLGGAL